jgi:hypothetical protein
MGAPEPSMALSEPSEWKALKRTPLRDGVGLGAFYIGSLMLYGGMQLDW